MDINVDDQQKLSIIGARLGSAVAGGEVIELIGDVGAGKTTLTKAIAQGMGISDDVGSPSYVLSQTYDSPSGLSLRHYDFYRLNDPGILAAELEEALLDERTVIVIEWGDIVAGLLPADHLQIRIVPTGETARTLSFISGGEKSKQLAEQLQ